MRDCRSLRTALGFHLGGALLTSRSLSDYLDYCRQLVLDEIRAIVPADRPYTGGLYPLMLDYPLRYGKSLRPALCIALCRATGGSLAAVLPTAAVLELYHNAFLIHDDVEDRSYLRRDEATLNRLHGVATAMNVGDAMLALTMQPLLQNTERIGLGKTLKILRTISRMALESAEGQMLELRWISNGAWDQVDSDYVRMVHKKTGWYSFIAPAMLGATIAGLGDREVEAIGRKFISLGIAFQLQDDILNLIADKDKYGKDLWGDLWEGKHTLILIHALRVTPPAERLEAIRILRKPPPTLGASKKSTGLDTVAMMDELVRLGEMTEQARTILLGGTRDVDLVHAHDKTEAEVEYLKDLVLKCGSIAYSRSVADRYAQRFRRDLGGFLDSQLPSAHRDFIADLADFTVNREL